MTKRQKTKNLRADLVLLSGGKPSVSETQIQLLQAIAAEGSISAAARAVGVSYKTAWDRIDTMNNLSDRTLVQRSAGGSGGGGSRLTDAGRELISGFRLLQRQHADYLASLADQVNNVSDVARFMKSTRLQTSARNQYHCTVSRIRRGGVNSEVELQIGDTARLVALITNDSRRQMNLKKGSELIALIKASWILLSTDIEARTSARNQLVGTVSKISKGEVNSEVILELGEGKTLCAIVTNPSVRELNLRKGVRACALFKASSVILMHH